MSPRPNKILRRGPFFTKFCRSLLLSVSKRGWCNPVVFFDISTMFFSSLHFTIVNSRYWNINLKPKQVKCLEAIYLGRDTTGYGKSIIFHLLPGLFYDKINSRSTLSSSSSPTNPVVIVVSPLNSLISNQIRRSTEGKVKATILNVTKSKTTEELELDSSGSNSLLLKEAKCDIASTHPEAVLLCQKGLELFQSTPYQQSVQEAVVDEAHCILEWLVYSCVQFTV